MRIVYVAKHSAGGNDDEGAIAYALGSLGHEVTKIDEKYGEAALDTKIPYDVLLFHKWSDKQALRYLPRTIKAFWYFDMVGAGDDPKLVSRSNQRLEWMRNITPLVDVGFCTDGDWVNIDRTGKLVHLMQGADARVVGLQQGMYKGWDNKLLFTGTIKNCGVGRNLFIDRIVSKYRVRYLHLKETYRESLRNVIGSVGIVLCPDAPVTDNYWSNRVYNAAGFGGVVAHKWTRGIAEHYTSDELLYYHSTENLYHQVERVLADPAVGQQYRENALARTMKDHTYTERCKTLLGVIAERFGVK